jgi:tetratricopeptide (TPR) repeat protein
MKKAISAAALCVIMMLTFSACSKNDSKSNTAANTTAETTVKTAQDKAAEAAAAAAKEKNIRLESKAQEGYDLFFDKKYDDAIAAEDAVIAEDPAFFKAYYIKGITQCYAGNYEGGSKNIDKALELNPDDYMARFNKALSLELYKHYDEALVWYQKALEVAKGQGEWSYYGIASIYGRRGNVADTVTYLKLAIDINPDIREEAKSESDFNPVKNSKEFKQLIGE